MAEKPTPLSEQDQELISQINSEFKKYDFFKF